MKVAAVQFDIVWQDKPANHRIIEDMLAAADIERDTYVLLPELGDTGFSFDLDQIVDDQTLPWARRLAQRLGIWLQPGFAEYGPDGKGRNCAAIISPQGNVLGIYRKVHPFSFGREIDHYRSGEELLLRSCPRAATCPMICYDLRFPELWRIAAGAGAEVFTIGASWPSARQSHWRALLIARAIENQAYVVSVNRVGADPHLQYVGGSVIVSPTGEILAEAQDAPTILQADLDLDALHRWRNEFPALKDMRRQLVGSIPLDATISPHSTLKAPQTSQE
ncbi:MAG: nitrilase-related carbon-nitrogen hydrolase [Phycisphaerales bacterium]